MNTRSGRVNFFMAERLGHILDLLLVVVVSVATIIFGEDFAYQVIFVFGLLVVIKITAIIFNKYFSVQINQLNDELSIVVKDEYGKSYLLKKDNLIDVSESFDSLLIRIFDRSSLLGTTNILVKKCSISIPELFQLYKLLKQLLPKDRCRLKG